MSWVAIDDAWKVIFRIKGTVIMNNLKRVLTIMQEHVKIMLNLMFCGIYFHVNMQNQKT